MTTDLQKAIYLIRHGWKEVPSDDPDVMAWLAPVNFGYTPLYFALEAAYALETEGEGIYPYAIKQALGELRRANDVAFMEQKSGPRVRSNRDLARNSPKLLKTKHFQHNPAISANFMIFPLDCRYIYLTS